MPGGIKIWKLLIQNKRPDIYSQKIVFNNAFYFAVKALRDQNQIIKLRIPMTAIKI